MGEKQTTIIKTPEQRQEFMQHILKDLKALEVMLERDKFEKGVKRVGAEQEINFVDGAWRPAPIAMEVLNNLKEKFITTEYAKFNLEINCVPVPFKKNFLKELKHDLTEKLEWVDEEAYKYNAKIVLTGILPTIRKSDVTAAALTPEPRFKALYNVVHEAKGKNYEFNIKGIDELITRDNPTLFGGCMTSFQVHLQVDAEDMVRKFNWAQAISGPLLACATNSPLFLNKRLWRETRIALFQQTTDTRKPYQNFKEEDARVSFGNDWVYNSILEVFKDDVARYHAFLLTDIEEDSVKMVEDGKIPQLKALNFHNGTIYKWNRPCYGIIDGKAHLRIENRIFPAGPTIEDQLANTAFWIGVMNGLPKEYYNIHKKMEFAEVKNNFLKAALHGLEVQFKWIDGKLIPAQELILNELLPIAREGLKAEKVDPKDINHYLGIIEERVKTGKTGSQWILDSFSKLSKFTTLDDAAVATTASMVKKQYKDKPVHTWRLASFSDAGNLYMRLQRVDQIMTTDIYTVKEDDVVDLAAHIMNWKNIGHVPVEDKKGHLVGIINKDSIINYLVDHSNNFGALTVKDVMIKDLITVSPEVPLTEAIQLFLDSGISCLPIVKQNKLVGLMTEHDFVKISLQLLHELLDLKNDKIDGKSKKQSIATNNRS